VATPPVAEHALQYSERHAEVAGEGEERAVSFRTDREPAVARAELHDVREQIVHIVIIEIGGGADDRVGGGSVHSPCGRRQTSERCGRAGTAAARVVCLRSPVPGKPPTGALAMLAAATPGAGAGLVLGWPASFKLDIGRAADANRTRTDLIGRRRFVVEFRRIFEMEPV